MIDTNNIIAVKPIPVVQEVSPTLSSERVSPEVRQQSRAADQIQSEQNRNKETSIDRKTAEHIVGQLNENFKLFNTRLSFSIDDKTNKTVIKIIDETNNEVIRQLPPEYLLKISQRISELLGLMVDEKA